MKQDNVAHITRPDAAHAASKLAGHFLNPSPAHTWTRRTR
jgi:hypothetical protein